MSQKATASQTTETKSNTQRVDVGKTEACPQIAIRGNIIQLQRRFGNRVVQKLYESGRLQGKLTIGQPGDKYEQEADRVSDQVMSMPDSQIRPKPT